MTGHQASLRSGQGKAASASERKWSPYLPPNLGYCGACHVEMAILWQLPGIGALTAGGTAKELAITACMCKPLEILNAMLASGTSWQIAQPTS